MMDMKIVQDDFAPKKIPADRALIIEGDGARLRVTPDNPKAGVLVFFELSYGGGLPECISLDYATASAVYMALGTLLAEHEALVGMFDE